MYFKKLKKVLLLLFVVKCHSLVGFKFELFDNYVLTGFVIYHILETNVRCIFFLMRDVFYRNTCSNPITTLCLLLLIEHVKQLC